VFRTSGQTKEQGQHGNGKKVMQHTEQPATDRGPGTGGEPRNNAAAPLTAASAPPAPRHQRWQREVAENPAQPDGPEIE